MYMFCGHKPVIQLATNISYFFQNINYLMISNMTSSHCVVCMLSSASDNIQAKNIKFSQNNFFSSVALWPDSGSWPLLVSVCNHTHWTHRTRQVSSGCVMSFTRNLYLTTHTTHKRWTTMLLAGFKPTVPARDQPQIYTLVHVATGISLLETIGKGNI